MSPRRSRSADHRLVDMTDPEPDFMEQFDPAELTEDRTDFDLGGDGRCIQKMIDWHNQVVWFAVMIEIYRDGRWHEVARADTCHNEAHVHRFSRGRRAETSRQVLRRVATIGDIQEAFDQSCEMLVEEWETNVSRWERG